MAKLLTPASVLKLKPGSKRIELRDGGCKGLILRIETTGHKTWLMRFRRPNGRLSRLTLGPVDFCNEDAAQEPEIGKPLTLASARRLATEVFRQRAFGHDFVAARERAELEKEERASKTFDKAAIDFIEQHAMRKTRRWHSQARLLGLRPKSEEEGGGLELIPKGLAYRWKDRPIADIDGDDIFAIVDETRWKGAPGLGRHNLRASEPRARTMHATLSVLFSWLVQRRRLKMNPCAGVHKPDTPKARERVLADEEIVRLWKASDRATEPFGTCVKLLLLTGCRLNEVCGMRRSELSADGKTWIIPGDRTKNHRTHVVPLSSVALEILASVETEGDLVFTTTGRTPISGWSKTKKHLDNAMLADLHAQNDDKVKSSWRLHDLRRTCATGMAEIGVPPHIVEACLNHVSGAKAGVAGTYSRHLRPHLAVEIAVQEEPADDHGVRGAVVDAAGPLLVEDEKADAVLEGLTVARGRLALHDAEMDGQVIQLLIGADELDIIPFNYASGHLHAAAVVALPMLGPDRLPPLVGLQVYEDGRPHDVSVRSYRMLSALVITLSRKSPLPLKRSPVPRPLFPCRSGAARRVGRQTVLGDP